jgi:potassium-dependent mechanosensitive channel
MTMAMNGRPRIVAAQPVSCMPMPPATPATPMLRLPLLLLFLMLAGHAAAVETTLPPSQAARIERERAALAQAGLDDALRREAETALAAAENAERGAEAAIEAVRGLREGVAVAGRERRALQARLAQEPTTSFREWQRRLPDSDDPERFEALLAVERGDVVRLRAEAAQVATALAALAAPPPDGSLQEAELRLSIDDLERRLAAASQGGAELPAPLAAIRLLRLRAELRAASAELLRRDQERDTAALRREHLELRQRALQRDLAEREQRMEVLQALIADRTDSRLGELVETLQARQLERAEAHPLLQQQGEESLRLARELIATHQSLARLRRELREIEQQRDQVTASLRDTRARLTLDSGSEALGLILLAERRRLAAPDALARRLEQVRRELAQARLRQIDLAQQRVAVDDLGATVSRLLAGADDLDDPEQQLGLGEQLFELLEERAALVPRLDTVLNRHVTALEHTEQALHTLWSETVVLRALLDRRLFWMPSHGRVDAAWLQRLPAGWADLLKPSRLATSGRLLLDRLDAAPLLPAVGLVLVVALFVWRRQAGARLQALVPPLRRVAEDSYRLTAHALLTTLLAALPWALLAWLLGDTLRQVGAAGKYSDSLGRAFIALAGGILLLDFLRWLVVERGLAHLHFRWMRARRQAIARLLPWLAAVLLPALFLGTLATVRNVDLAIDTAGRLSLFAFAAFAAWALWQLLAPGALWTVRGGGSLEPNRQRQLLRLALPAALLAIAGGLLGGYVYSGWVLMVCLWQSLWAVVGVVVVHGMLARWFLLGERRLAWQRLQAQREAGLVEAADDSGELLAEVAAPELTLESVNAQTGRLLRALTLTLWVTALFFIWSDVLPALDRLDEIALWSYSTLAEDGSRVSAEVTLKAALFGIVVLALTFVAAGNLPGLLEIGLLTRIRLDASTRYAIASVSRYLIVIVGGMAGLALLGLRWSQLQWMAAALSVGLGFGLQEIFGNFVSGLILLFERPFRVGDVITIGEYTGTVSRIRTRATTLIDFDNKEVVVPNKAFITERLINWTLSDNRTRIVLRVGVAYGSDVQRVHALLQRAAAEHPLVLKEPAPRSWFLAFGASSLDFELRMFVDALADRLPVTSEVNAAIATLFAEAGIEIAFPQLDLHVRDLPAPPRDAAGAPDPAAPG